MTVYLDTFPLAAGGMESPADWSVTQQRVVQTTNPVRARTTKSLPREDRRTDVSFKVTRLHDSVQDAEEFVIDHPSAVPSNGTLVVTADSQTGAWGKRSMPDCCIQNVAMRHTGKTSVATYSLTGGEFVTTKVI